MLALLMGILKEPVTEFVDCPVTCFETNKFEDPRFSEGTSVVAKILSESEAYSIIGGGETITSFANINLMDSVDYASTAGGAFLEYIENNSLPCIDKIINKNKG